MCSVICYSLPCSNLAKLCSVRPAIYQWRVCCNLVCALLKTIMLLVDISSRVSGLTGLVMKRWDLVTSEGTTVAATPPFRPCDPAFCMSRPLVTPYYCRLGDLLCFVFISAYCMFDLSVYYLFLQYFDTVGVGLLTCENRLPYNLYCVGGDVKHCSVQSMVTATLLSCFITNKWQHTLMLW